MMACRDMAKEVTDMETTDSKAMDKEDTDKEDTVKEGMVLKDMEVMQAMEVMGAMVVKDMDKEDTDMEVMQAMGVISVTAVAVLTAQRPPGQRWPAPGNPFTTWQSWWDVHEREFAADCPPPGWSIT